MRRFWYVAALLPAVLGGCTIEETPQQYIDHLTTPAAEVEAARDELMARLISIAPALSRGDRTSLTGALAPAPDVYVLRDRREDALVTAREVVDTLLSIAGDREVAVGESIVNVGANNSVAWFRAAYVVTGDGDAEENGELNFSGVFIRQEGDWRLTQGHLSTPVTPPPPPQSQAEADTPPEDG